MRVGALSVRHSGMEPLSIICDGAGAGTWDNTIVAMWVPCQGGGGDMIGGGVGHCGCCTSLSAD